MWNDATGAGASVAPSDQQTLPYQSDWVRAGGDALSHPTSLVSDDSLVGRSHQTYTAVAPAPAPALSTAVPIAETQQPQAPEPPANPQYGYPALLRIGAWTWIVILTVCIGLFSWQQVTFAPSWSDSCDYRQKVWATTWWASYVISAGLASVASCMLAYRSGPPAERRPVYLRWTLRIMDLFALVWFCYGISAVFFPPDGVYCNIQTKRWCYAGFILQAIFLFLPCLLVIVCLPFLFLLLRSERMQALLLPFILGPPGPPTSNQTPTPEEIISKIETNVFGTISEDVARAHAGPAPPPSAPTVPTAEDRNSDAARQLVQDALPAPLTTAVSQILQRMATGQQQHDTSSVDIETGQHRPGSMARQGSVARVSVAQAQRSMSIKGCMCPICFVEFGPTDVVMCLPCDRLRHIFHEDCLKEWLHKSQLCPMCRANVADLLKAKSPTADSTDMAAP